MASTVSTKYRSQFLGGAWAEGLAEGRTEGLAEGRTEGLAEGRAEGEVRAVLTVLDARGVYVPEKVRERIEACTDLERLETWLRRALTATTVDEVIA
jgi:hypothetical protein